MPHTPAPWKVKENGKHETPSVWSSSDFEMSREICRIKDVPGQYKENARLISKAPALLEILEEIADVISSDPNLYNLIGKDRYNKALAVIKDATA